MSDKRAARRREQRAQPKPAPLRIDRTVVVEPGDTIATVMGKVARIDVMYGGPITIEWPSGETSTLPAEYDHAGERGESVIARCARAVGGDSPLYPPRIVSQRTFDALVTSGLPLAYVTDNDRKP